MFSIGGIEKKQLVGLAVTPNLGLEACVYDKKTDEVVKYGQKFVEYNLASKEIQDPNAFRSAVSDLMDELGISKDSSNIFLVLPNVHFGFRSIDDPSVDADAIESMILSETSESYVFKKEEPISAWADVNSKNASGSRYIAHSSFQRSVIEEIQDACMDIGISVIGIESAISAIPRGIYETKICQNEIENNQNWDILLINPNSYAIFQMSGSRMLDYVEVPFAIMSFEGEEVYSALSSAVAQYLPNYPAKKLVIVSQTDNVSANILKNEIVFDEDIAAIESNKFGTSPCAKVSEEVIKQMASSMSMCVLGASIPKINGFITLNVLGNVSYDGTTTYGTIEVGGNEIEISSENVVKYSLLLSGIMLGLIVFICGIMFGISSYFGVQANNKQAEITKLQSEISALENKIKAGIITLIKQISEKNKTGINFYDSLSSDIPSHVWLNYYYNKDGDSVAIEGYSLEINDIYEYYKSLKILAPKSNILLNELEVFSDENNEADIDSMAMNDVEQKQQVFKFVISNVEYVKTFNESGNKKSPEEMKATQKGKPAAKKPAKASKAAKIPLVPDIEINLKEIK